MDCSLPRSSIQGNFQARVLEWVAISFSRGSSRARDRTRVSCIAGRRFTIGAAREVKVDLSAILDPFDFNRFMLYPWAMSFFQQLCPGPSLLFHALFLSPVQPHNVASTIIWKDNQLALGREILYDIQSLWIFRPSSSMSPTT